MTHQALTTGCPEYLRNLIEVLRPLGNTSTRNTENGVTLFRHIPETHVGARAFKIATLVVYNSIPIEIRQIENMDTFKRRLKTFLFSECYDLVDLTIHEQYKVT